MEIGLFIRYFGITLISLYVYTRILNIKDLPKTKIAVAIIFSLMVGVLLSNRLFFSHGIILISVCIFVCTVLARSEKGFAISVAVIATGISFGLEVFSTLILMIIESAYHYIIMAQTGEVLAPEEIVARSFLVADPIIIALLFLIISICIIGLLSKIKRLKKGFIFWENKNVMRIGMIISMFIITARILLGAINFLTRNFYIEELIGIVLLSYPYSVILLLFIFIFISACLIGIYFWWQHHITLLYQQQQKERIIKELQTENNEKDKQIESLSKSNDFLSKVIHRDNKLIPAMYNAVNNFLINSENIETKTRGTIIGNELNEVMQERKDMVLKIQRDYKSLPLTGTERIDTILSYMLSKATEKDIEFDFVYAGCIKDIAENIITKQKLETLLADLIDNAIIATSYSTYRRIQTTIGIVDDCLEISVQDSGIPFEVETLTNLGLRKATTHADTGGSGIGYMTIFEILKESGASITITEHTPENYAFTKSIKIRFNGKSEHTINSYRASEVKLSTEREDITISENH